MFKIFFSLEFHLTRNQKRETNRCDMRRMFWSPASYRSCPHTQIYVQISLKPQMKKNTFRIFWQKLNPLKSIVRVWSPTQIIASTQCSQRIVLEHWKKFSKRFLVLSPVRFSILLVRDGKLRRTVFSDVMFSRQYCSKKTQYCNMSSEKRKRSSPQRYYLFLSKTCIYSMADCVQLIDLYFHQTFPFFPLYHSFSPWNCSVSNVCIRRISYCSGGRRFWKYVFPRCFKHIQLQNCTAMSYLYIILHSGP